MIPARLQWYVLREMLRVALISTVALTAVIFVGMSLSLMRKGLNILQVYDVLPYAAAMSLPYALPCAFLLGSVFVFGRLSGSNEINAMRCSGVNLNTVILPPLLLALLICAGTFGLNHYLLPWSMERVSSAGAEIVADYLGSMSGSSRQKIGRYSVYVGSTDVRTRIWRDVVIIEFTRSFPTRVIKAREGRFAMADGDRQVILMLKGVNVYHPRLNEPEQEKPAQFGELRFSIPLDLEGDKEQSEIRPKFLALPELVKLRASLREKVAAVRASGGYAGVSRPKSRRKEMQKKKEAAYRALSTLEREQVLRQSRLTAARAAVVEAQTLVASAQNARERIAQQAQEAQVRLNDLQVQIDELAAQRKQVEQEENAQERLDRIDREIATLTVQAGGVKERLNGVKSSLDKAQAELATRTAEHADNVAAQSEAQRFAAELDDQVPKALAEFTQLRTQWEGLRAWERYLEADSDFESRNAGSLATFLFVLIGIPLGILSRRGNVIMAFLLSFGAVLAVYYPLAMIGQMLDADGYLPARIAEWMPSAAVGTMGLGLMLWGVRR